MAQEKRNIEINSRADTLDLMHPDIRPWPVTPPPDADWVMANTYAKRKAEDFGKWCEDNLRYEYAFGKPEALQGFKFLCTGLYRLGNKFCAALLCEAGAEVINIEPPEGDPLRQLTPFGREEYMLTSSITGEKCGLDFLHEMRGQKSVTLNLEEDAGRAIYKTLAGQVDAIIDEMPPGYMDSLGLGYRNLSKLYPRLVYCNMAVRGTWGPYKDKISKYGQWTLEPFGGCANSFVHNTGFPQDQCPRGKGGDPCRSGVWFADYAAGEQAANTILAALYWRNEFSGEGQFCEVTGAEAQMDILDFDIGWYGFNGSIKARTGAWDPNLNQYEWNPCRDGYMMIGGQTDRLWYRIGMCIERDFPQFGRLIHEDPILKEMGARNALAMLIKTYTVTTRWLRDINRIEAEQKLMEYEIAAGPILFIDEVSEFPHFKYRPWVCTIDTDHYGTVLFSVSPNNYQMRTPHRVKVLGRPLGFDTYEVMQKYCGIGQTKVNELKEKGVI
ncbi:MAG: CaiB/BaiF CoA transferase family protein [Thermodesulfobacteriota bacterium]